LIEKISKDFLNFNKNLEIEKHEKIRLMIAQEKEKQLEEMKKYVSLISLILKK